MHHKALRSGRHLSLGLLSATLLCLGGPITAATLQGTVSGSIGVATVPLSRATICLANDSTACWLSRSNGTFRLDFTPESSTGLDRKSEPSADLSKAVLRIRTGSAGAHRLDIVDLSGRSVARQRLRLEEGPQAIRLPPEALAFPGMTILRVSGPGGTWKARLLRGEGVVESDAIAPDAVPSVAGRIAGTRSLVVSAPGYMRDTVSIPLDSSNWKGFSITLARTSPQDVLLSVEPGPFWSPFLLDLGSIHSGGIVHFTTDGAVPTLLSDAFATSLPISTSTTVRARVFRNDSALGPVVDAAYHLQRLALDKASGSYPGSVHVVASNLEGDERYTLDGSLPRSNSALWNASAGLEIGADAFLVVRSFEPNRAPVSAEYTIVDPYEPTLLPKSRKQPYFFDTTAVVLEVAEKWAGAQIRYTTDGSSPTTLSSLYEGPIGIWKSTLVRARAYSGGFISPVADLPFTLNSPTPTPGFDTSAVLPFQDSVQVRLFAAGGMPIRYTTDGTIPTLASALFTEPFWVKSTTTVKAFCGVRNPSEVAERTYTNALDPTLATSTPTPNSFYDTTAVALSLPGKWTGAQIRYTTDGSSPTTLSNLYEGPIPLWSSTLVKTKAFSKGFVGPVTEHLFTRISPTPAPLFDTTTTSFTDSVRVVIHADAGLPIRYTTDGTLPTASSPSYTGPFWLTSTAIVSAVCGTRNPSAVASRIFKRDGTPRISPDSGFLSGESSVTVSISSINADIRYTTDGTAPTALSTAYTGPITLTSFPVTLKALSISSKGVATSTTTVTYLQTIEGISIPSPAPFVPRFP